MGPPRPFRSIGPLLAALCLLPAVGALPPTKAWRDGPVRYLLSDEEYRRFGRLPDEAARSRFIDDFWSELDPDPSAPGNGFRDAFETRCREADERFGAPGGPGWATDRGRVYILLGPPAAIRRRSAGFLAVDQEVWDYGGGGTDAHVGFYRCPDGQYMLDPDCPTAPLASATADWDRVNAVRWARTTDPNLSRERMRYLIDAFLAPMERSSAPQPRSSATAPPAATASPPTGPSSPITTAAYFFRARDGNVLTLLALELRPREGAGTRDGDAPARPRAAVAIEPRPGAAGLGAQQMELRAWPDDGGGAVPLWFGRTYLPPRSGYAARFVVQDGAAEAILVRAVRLDVPDLDGFSTSSIVPAESFGPAGEAGTELFRVGSEEVVPRPGAVFRRGELLRLYVQVYGAKEDPATSMASVDVAFRFRRLGKGRPKSPREPFTVRGAAGASMGLALPIGDWAEGDYEVEADFRDRIADRSAVAVGRFRIAGADREGRPDRAR